LKKDGLLAFLFPATNENHFLLSKIPKKRVMLSLDVIPLGQEESDP
jgi:hypothetical protein